MHRLTVIVLAGGGSVRMGAPKALLRFGAETAIERVLRRLRACSDARLVVSGPHLALPRLDRDVRLVEDPEPLLGPLAGIRNGLRAASTDFAFVCGCDQPLIEPAVVGCLAAAAAGGRGAAAVWDGHPQPLVAVYRRDVAEIADRMLREGNHRARQLVARAGLAVVGEERLRAVDPTGASFFDVDTPEAHAEALRRIAAEGALRLFVYGTLRRGGPYHERFCAGARSIEPARAGGTLGRLPAGYPVLGVPEASILAHGSADVRADLRTQENCSIAALARDAGIVDGELITFDDATDRLPAIDALEDFHPGAPSLYERVLIPVEVTATGHVVSAWAYVGNRRV